MTGHPLDDDRPVPPADSFEETTDIMLKRLADLRAAAAKRVAERRAKHHTNHIP